MPQHWLYLEPRNALALLVAVLTGFQPALASQAAQAAPARLNLVIVEGEGAINNIRQRTAREPIVQVTDENDRPVAGATVFFLLPDSGPGGAFAGGGQSLKVVTDNQGRAVMRGFRANAQSGKYQIKVEASYQNLTASTTINQANAVLTAGAAAGAGGAGKLIAILAVVGAGVAGGVFAATRSGNGSSNGTPTPPVTSPTVITPGTPSVGGP